MGEIEIRRKEIKSEIPITYHHLNQDSQSLEKPLLIFFHGYSDSAKGLLRRAFPSLDQKYEILAINGLFPLPQKKEDGWKPAFSWYFADFLTNSVLIHPEVSAKAVTHLIEDLGLQERKKVLLGFSQGGFFIPFVLPKLKNVVHLFGIGAAYREEDYNEKLTVPLDALHGTDDEVVPYKFSEESFENFVAKKNPKGRFHRFEGLKHTMNDEARLWLKQRLDEVVFGAMSER